MSNSSTGTARYPYPYSVVDGCLYMEDTNKNGTTTAKKLSNFTPYIKSTITVDNGAEEKVYLRLGGEHANGRTLPEIDVKGSELSSFNWLIDSWGADCVLEPGSNIKDRVRHATQLTARDEDRKFIYLHTGWKIIDGSWEYLLPNDGVHDVELQGKMSRYEKATGWSDEDLKILWSMFWDRPIAPKEITYTLLAYTFLSPLNEFLHQVFHEPKFILMLTGHTGTRKSTLAALFLSFFGRFSGADLPMSFQDTANSMMQTAAALKDVLTCIDDYHPGGRQDERGQRDKMQTIARGYGDRAAKGKLNRDSTPMKTCPPQGNVIVTAENQPDIGESGTARCFSLELRHGDVEPDNLSFFQREAESGTLMRCMLSYIEQLKASYLHSENTLHFLLGNLREQFESYRKEFLDTGIRCHGRVPEIFAWLMIGMDYLLDFLYYREIIADVVKEAVLNEFRDILYEIAARQSAAIEQDKPTHKFIQKLHSLMESGQAVVLNRKAAADMRPTGFIGYEDEDYYYLNADAAHRMVKKLCDDQGELFSIPKNALIKALAEEGLTVCDKGKNTKSVRMSDKTHRFICLIKEKADAVDELS